MPSVDVKVEGLAGLLSNIKVFKDAAEAAAVDAMATVTTEIAGYAQANHAFQNRTGNLEASIHALPVEKEGEQIVGAVKAGMKYAQWVEFGHKGPYEIPNAFGKGITVIHPPNAPRPFLVPAVEANKQNLLDTMSKALARAEKAVKMSK